MEHVGTIERFDTTTYSYKFDYHVIRDEVELANIFAGYTGPVVIDGRSSKPEDFRPFVLFRLDNGMKYYLDSTVADKATESGMELPIQVRRPKYEGTDYFQGL